jgi:MinD superfamily P-loop ATPase
MKQLLLLSGKGGTGKTTLASAFIALAEAKAFADCDVDAPNLHLVGKTFPEKKTDDYFSLPVASIDRERCTKCGACLSVCRFDAIKFDGTYTVDPFSCEGCGACAFVCKSKAIEMQEHKAGELDLFSSDTAVFSTARLEMGSGTTGKLVTKVKEQLAKNAPETDLAIVDGSPGIGCPVIASLAGADLVLVVAEPSVSGLSDLLRIVQTASILGVKCAICINKYDTNLNRSAQIEAYCWKQGIPYVGKIPFDRQAVQAINEGKTIADVACPSGCAARTVFARTMELLREDA